MADFKKLSAVDVVESVNDSVTVLIEEDGVIKRAPKTAVGGAGNDDTNTIIIASNVINGERYYVSADVYQALRKMINRQAWFNFVLMDYRVNDIIFDNLAYISLSESTDEEIVAYFSSYGMSAYSNGEIAVYEL